MQWVAYYTDGAVLSQDDTTHPLYAGDEVPFRAIEWDRVTQLGFRTDDSEHTVVLARETGWRLALRRRTFLALDGQSLSCFILTISTDDPVTTTHWAYYWFPTGETHACARFDCSVVRAWGARQVHTITGDALPSQCPED